MIVLMNDPTGCNRVVQNRTHTDKVRGNKRATKAHSMGTAWEQGEHWERIGNPTPCWNA